MNQRTHNVNTLGTQAAFEWEKKKLLQLIDSQQKIKLHLNQTF